ASTYEPHPHGIAVYNFAVDDYHTYFVAGDSVGAVPVWVHNTDRCFNALTLAAREEVDKQIALLESRGGTTSGYLEEHGTTILKSAAASPEVSSVLRANDRIARGASPNIYLPDLERKLEGSGLNVLHVSSNQDIAKYKLDRGNPTGLRKIGGNTLNTIVIADPYIKNPLHLLEQTAHEVNTYSILREKGLLNGPTASGGLKEVLLHPLIPSGEAHILDYVREALYNSASLAAGHPPRE